MVIVNAICATAQDALKRRNNMIEYTNSKMCELIDEHIHSAKYRDILKDRFIDGLTFEQIAELRDISPRQAQNIVYRAQDELMRHLSF